MFILNHLPKWAYVFYVAVVRDISVFRFGPAVYFCPIGLGMEFEFAFWSSHRYPFVHFNHKLGVKLSLAAGIIPCMFLPGLPPGLERLCNDDLHKKGGS